MRCASRFLSALARFRGSCRESARAAASSGASLRFAAGLRQTAAAPAKSLDSWGPGVHLRRGAIA
jgi:hypothetical protein